MEKSSNYFLVISDNFIKFYAILTTWIRIHIKITDPDPDPGGQIHVYPNGSVAATLD